MRYILLILLGPLVLLMGATAQATDTKMLFDCLMNILGHEDLKAVRHIKTEEERVAFMNAFWRLRDPIPETPINEGRLIYENRCREADRLFGAADAGPRGERGRYWTLLGAPNERTTKLFPLDAPGTVAGEHRVVETEHWIYYSLPNMGRHEIRFVRLAYSPQFKLAANVDILHKFTAPVFSASALSVAMEDSRAVQGAVEPVDAERTLQNLLEQEGLREDFPFLMEVSYLRGDEGMTTMYVTARLRPQDVSADPPENWNFAAGARLRKEKEKGESDAPVASADPFALPVDEPSGTEAEDIIVELLPYAKNAELKGVRYYQVAFRVRSGKYTLIAGMVNQGSGKASVKRLVLDVPSIEPPYPKVSTPVIVRGSVRTLTAEQLPAYRVKEGFAPFVVGDEHLIVPRFNNVFSKKANDNLVLYCQIYNPPSESATRNAPYTVELVRSLRMNEPERDGGVWNDFKRFKPETLQGGTGNAWWFETPAELLKQYYKGTYRYEITFKDAADPSKATSTVVEFELTD